MNINPQPIGLPHHHLAWKALAALMNSNWGRAKAHLQ